mmetsp:Transcript_85959/g.270974  ORF Transcript_85959/g.270974 Transcript_85959/m.270974 type:complete len:254 (-) Transcript_85959:780-1541(-)
MTARRCSDPRPTRPFEALLSSLAHSTTPCNSLSFLHASTREACMRPLPMASDSFRPLFTEDRTMRSPALGPGSVGSACLSSRSCQDLAASLPTPTQSTTSSIAPPPAEASPWLRKSWSWVSPWSLVSTSPAGRSRAAVTIARPSRKLPSTLSEQLAGSGACPTSTGPSGGQMRSRRGINALRPGSTSIPRAAAVATRAAKPIKSELWANRGLPARFVSWKSRISRSLLLSSRFAGRYCSSLACVTLHSRGALG